MIETSFQGPFRTARPIVLASASPRRQKLLTSLGICFHVIPSRYVEPKPGRGESPLAYAMACASQKSLHLPAVPGGCVVLSADTVVACQGRILGKPRDVDDAFSMLAYLSGRAHEVITGCSLYDTETDERTPYSCSTTVHMHRMSEDVLWAYASCGEPMDKAGAYAVQGAGGFLVKEVSGSVSNVIGLPLAETVHAFLKCKAITTTLPGKHS